MHCPFPGNHSMGAPVPAAIHYPQMLDLWRPSRSRVPGRGLGTRTALRSRDGGREVGWDGRMGEVLSSKGSPWWGPSSGEGLGSLSCRQSVVTTASSRITLSQEKAQGKGRQSGEEERLARAAFPLLPVRTNELRGHRPRLCRATNRVRDPPPRARPFPSCPLLLGNSPISQ